MDISLSFSSEENRNPVVVFSPIISLNMLMNLSDSIMWFAVPELNDTYLEMNMGDLGMDMSSALGSLEDMPDIMSALPSEEQLSKLLTRYIELALANIKNVERTATTLELDGLKQDCTQMSVKLYQADAQAVLKAVASAALEDKDLQADYIALIALAKNILEQCIDLLGFSAPEKM